MDARAAIEATAIGRPMKATVAAEAGLLSELVAPDGLLDRARAIAASAPKSTPRARPVCVSDEGKDAGVREALESVEQIAGADEPASSVYACVERGLDSGWDEAIAMERDELVRLRNTDKGRASIEAFFEKTKKT